MEGGLKPLHTLTPLINPPPAYAQAAPFAAYPLAHQPKLVVPFPYPSTHHQHARERPRMQLMHAQVRRLNELVHELL